MLLSVSSSGCCFRIRVGARGSRWSLWVRPFGQSGALKVVRRGWLDRHRLPTGAPWMHAQNLRLPVELPDVRSRLLGMSSIPLFAKVRFHTGSYSSAGRQQSQHSEAAEALLDICERRHFLRRREAPQQRSWDSYLKGSHLGFGPLAVELRKNLAAQWWETIVVFREQVFVVDTPVHDSSKAVEAPLGERLRVVPSKTLWEVLENEDLSKQELLASLEKMLKVSGMLRSSLLHGQF